MIFRAVAISVAVLAMLALVIGFYRARSNREFRMKGFPTALSKDVIAQIGNYERTETEGDLRKYYIRADRATTYSDNHQELENVYLEVFDEAGAVADKITAGKGIYVPGENKDFTAYFAGSVNIETRDALKVRTEQVTYRKDAETAEAEELVEFERGNISGRAFGALVNIREKRLELLKDVEIDTFEADPAVAASGNGIKNGRLTANYAVVDQIAERIDLKDQVFVSLVPASTGAATAQPTEIKASNASVGFIDKQVRTIGLTGNVEVYQKPTPANSRWSRTRSDRADASVNGELKRADLTGNVEIETGSNDAKTAKITCGRAIYEKDADRFELHESVVIATTQNDRPTTARSADAVYEQTAGKIGLTGGAEIENGQEYVKADRIDAVLFPDRALREASAKGTAFLRQNIEGRQTEVSADEINAFYGNDRQLQTANAIGRAVATLVPSEPREYSRVTMNAPRAIRLTFRGAGMLDQFVTDGRTTILLTPPDRGDEAATKKITADSVKTRFNAGGRDLEHAEAVGNAELRIEPLAPKDENYVTTVTAPRFDCEFFATGNNARVCNGATRTKTVRVPTVSRERRGVQTLTSDTISALFQQASGDIDQLEAAGNAKFNELDRNGIASRIVFASKEKIVKLRGGEPTVWDARARAKAPEIDWDTKNQRSYLRGGVSTTYYNQKQTGGSAPFSNSNKPVFLTSANAEFDHAAEIGIYTGNARAWQDDNYVRAEKLILRQKEGQMFAEGSVQSLLYDAKTSDRKKSPVFAAAQMMSYDRNAATLRYEDSVDIRQGADRVTAGIATVLLTENNEMKQTTVERDVVMTQPKRRATGNWAQYTNETDVAILRGDPAVVEDAENGSTQGAQITVYNRENRVINESKTEPNSSGRIRSVYKVKKN